MSLNTNDMQIRFLKLRLLAFFSLTALLPLAALWDLFASIPLVPYALLLVNVLLLVSFLRPVGVLLNLILGSMFVASVYAAIIAPIPIGQLAVYDQHMSVFFMETLMKGNGIQSHPSGFRVRGSHKLLEFPLLYVLLAFIGLVNDSSAFTVVRAFPLFVLTSIVFLGGCVTERWREYVAFVWLIPVTFRYSMSTVHNQLYALPLLALLIIAIKNGKDYRYVLIGLISVFALPISHSLTALIGLFLVAAVTAINYFSESKRMSKWILLYPVVLVSVWMIVDARLFTALGFLLTGGPMGLLEFFSSPSSLTRIVPHSNMWWVGQTLRVYAIIIVFLVFTSILVKRRHLAFLFDRNVALYLVGSSVALGFYPLTNLRRTWVFGTVVASLFLAAALDHRDVLDWSNISSIVGGGLLITTLFTYFRYKRNQFSPAPTGVKVAFATGIVLAILLIVIGPLGRLIERKIRSPFLGESRNPTGMLVTTVILLLIVGSLMTGVNTDVFSSDKRAEALDSPGRDRYHEAWDYSTASFLDEYTLDKPVGDKRIHAVFMMYHRRPYKDIEGRHCYHEKCRFRTVVWYDSYSSVWQTLGGQEYWTQFESGYLHLSNERAKVYSTGQSSVFINSTAAGPKIPHQVEV